MTIAWRFQKEKNSSAKEHGHHKGLDALSVGTELVVLNKLNWVFVLMAFNHLLGAPALGLGSSGPFQMWSDLCHGQWKELWSDKCGVLNCPDIFEKLRMTSHILVKLYSFDV